MGIKEVHEYTAAELEELQRSQTGELVATLIFYGLVCVFIVSAVSALVVFASLTWDTIQRKRYMNAISSERKMPPKRKWG